MSNRNTRETLKDFLNSKGSTQDRITYTLKSSPDGLGKDPGTEEELLDLANDVKGLLGDYVSFIVNDSSNEFKIKPGNELAASSKRGDDLVLPEFQGAEKVFVGQGTVLKSKLNENSNSGYFNSSGTDLNTLIDKTSGNFSNHDKLKEIQGRDRDKYGNITVNPPGEDNDIVKATQKVFLKNNRFANVDNENTSAFTNENKNIADFESKDFNEGTMAPQNEFGNFKKDDYKVSIDELKEIGASLLLKASGFASGLTPRDSGLVSDIEKNLASINSAFISDNGFNKKSTSDLRAKYAKGFPEDSLGNSLRDGRGESIGVDGDARNATTFGATYNHEYTFSTKNYRKHRIEAAVTLIALKSIAQSFYSTFLNLLRGKDRIDLAKSGENFVRENPDSDPTEYMLGMSKTLSSNKINHRFKNIITNTEYPYGDCVDEGLKLILGRDDNDPSKAIKQDVISQSPGFWLAVSRSVLKSYNSIYDKHQFLFVATAESIAGEDLFRFYKDLLESNSLVRFFNAMAVIGDIHLRSNNGLKEGVAGNARDVDKITDNRAIPGKSRKKFGLNKNELSWNQDEPPSMFILPANIIRAASKLNNTVYGESPVRGMFGSKLIKSTYTGVDVDGSYNRIPNEVVKIVEDRLEAEYVPFYIQDLRTNEILSFHAFLSQLTDSINPTFNGVTGYGRVDPVQIYQTTSRNLQVGFTLYATNREDYDAMWYKINKFTTLLYPQWTAGTLVSNDANAKSKFYQPFSQVIGASPIVRLRVGDVIKSNYSRFGLARLFGIGDDNVSPKSSEGYAEGTRSVFTGEAFTKFKDQALKVWLAAFGSPMSIVNSIVKGIPTDNLTLAQKIGLNSGTNLVYQILSNLLVNGYANPLAVGGIVKQLRDPNLDPDNSFSTGNGRIMSNLRRNINNSSLFDIKTGNGIAGGYNTQWLSNAFREMILKPNTINGYYCEETGKRYLLPRRIKVRVIDKGLFDDFNSIKYRVKVLDHNAPKEVFKSHFIVNHSDILPDPKELFTNSAVGALLFFSDPTGLIDNLGDSFVSDNLINAGLGSDIVDYLRTLYASDESIFMRKEVNPFTRAINTTKGRGLAGVIKGVTFDWLDGAFAWETDLNARAPMGVKISFQFDVIHDIPPGLDHTGYNRAPIYNVGEIMKNISGDVYDDDGRVANYLFREQGGFASTVKGEDNR